MIPFYRSAFIFFEDLFFLGAKYVLAHLSLSYTCFGQCTCLPVFQILFLSVISLIHSSMDSIVVLDFCINNLRIVMYAYLESVQLASSV
jgi:hypothetical protein